MEAMSKEYLKESLPDQEPGALHKAAMNSRPLFESNKAALDAYTHELALLARKAGKTTEQLVADADDSPLWDEDNRRILELSNLISVMSCREHQEQKA